MVRWEAAGWQAASPGGLSAGAEKKACSLTVLAWWSPLPLAWWSPLCGFMRGQRLYALLTHSLKPLHRCSPGLC